jgi:proteasome lid subunit RPN8/RPN11
MTMTQPTVGAAMRWALSQDIIAAIKAHAQSSYPAESCGFVTRSGYLACTNRAADPSNQFLISPDEYLKAGQIFAVVHSHTNGRDYPSEADMRGQLSAGVPWGVLLTNGQETGDVLWWGDGVQIPDLIGRPFRPGPSGSDGKGDCYALIRDWYRLTRGVTLLEFPRESDWFHQGQNLYEDGFGKAGFRPLAAGEQPQEGDVALMCLLPRITAAHHAGIYLGGGLLLHHLDRRLSAREPAERWAKHIKLWIRYEGSS